MHLGENYMGWNTIKEVKSNENNGTFFLIFIHEVLCKEPDLARRVPCGDMMDQTNRSDLANNDEILLHTTS